MDDKENFLLFSSTVLSKVCPPGNHPPGSHCPRGFPPQWQLSPTWRLINSMTMELPLPGCRRAHDGWIPCVQLWMRIKLWLIDSIVGLELRFNCFTLLEMKWKNDPQEEDWTTSTSDDEYELLCPLPPILLTVSGHKNRWLCGHIPRRSLSTPVSGSWVGTCNNYGLHGDE